MVDFQLSPELTPLLARFLAARSPVDTSRAGGAARPPLWEALVEEVGVAGLLVPEELGGQGAGLLELGAAVHELGVCGWSGPVVATAGVAVHLLGALDPDDATGLRAAIAVEGRVVVAALHEDPAGSSVATTLSWRGDRLRGRRTLVDSGTHADTFLVPALDEDDVPVLLRVDAGADGARVTPMDAMDPGRGLADLDLDDVEAAVVVARGTDVTAALEDAWLVGALLVAADLVGTSARVLDVARDYAVEREQFGRAVASFQSVKHKLVDMYADLETSRSMVRQALLDAAAGSERWRLSASAAKVRTGDAGAFVVREGIQVHGGIGFTWEHEMSHHFRRAMAQRGLYGTPTVHRRLVADRSGF
ncbi:acyl-CoA dehydrogenase family protein [Nocardioides hwasunensis]|uniref:Acyl-CoA dehydrogenase family protein n=1 Tax=Nocardioides hwasunensis TaxID=397258 RepID=A0ABR8MJ51_9ACTN|nr:acyl-CoA dehydrogenase family protein [Nocardioides hwasunensis]MBD3915610.1 acyl-CoA dehydrogenase family protein [Nocardioides hwasunensis]